ncbi:MAG: hypothetical protein AB7F19_06840 [Candidatus Babeliales bacterium]
MKRYVWLFLLFNILLILFSTRMRADIDCMDNSFHLDRSCGPDFKKYHHVQCNCPCSRYRHSFNRGRCEQCWHYRAPRALEIVRYQPSEQCEPEQRACTSVCRTNR